MKLLFCAFIQDLTYVGGQIQAVNFCLFHSCFEQVRFSSIVGCLDPYEMIMHHTLTCTLIYE